MKKIILIVVLATLSILMVCGCGTSKKEVTAEEAAKVLEGKVKVPDPYFKTQEEVEAMFEAAGLVPKFVVRNFDEKATTNNRYLRAGECDKLGNDSGASYYDSDEVGDAYGYYADEGATIIVGYSDHDFDGTAGEDGEVAETTAPEKETEVETKEETEAPNDSSESSTDTSENSEIPDDIIKQVEELNEKYDKIIEKVQGFNDNPETYTMSAYTEFTADYTDILSDYGKLSDSLDEHEDSLSSWDGYDIWMSILNKNTQLLDAVSKMPSTFAD